MTGDTPADAEAAAEQIEALQRRMREAADNLEFELAADIRDRIRELEAEFAVDVTDGVAPDPDAEF